MAKSQETYRKIIKSTSLFGGVQVVNLILSIVRSKVLAVLIGPTGYGIFALLTSLVELIKQATGFSLEVTGVKKISETKDDTNALVKNSSLLIKLSILTGLLGMFLVIIFSYYLSVWTFGTKAYTLGILLISIIILIKQINGAYSAILQGLSKLTVLAKAGIYGNVVGFIITIPLFFMWGIDAIIPSMILTSLLSLLISYVYYKKIGIRKVRFSFKESISESKKLLLFGGLFSLNGFLPVLSNYLLLMFVNHFGGINDVGLLNVGLLVINTYVGIVFTAMSTEYYPRISTFHTDSVKINEAVNQQIIISCLILIPVIVLFFGYAPAFIKILFSHKFDGVVPFLLWGIFAMFFKAVSWSMGYIIIAKADSRIFVKTSILFNCLYLLLCIAGYHYAGFYGLGMAFLTYYIIHLFIIYSIVHIKYEITLTLGFYKIFTFGLIICTVSFLLNCLEESIIRQGLYILLFIVAILFSLYEISKRIDIKSIFTKLKSRIRK